MGVNATLIVQMITFMVFVWFTLKFVWPPIHKAMSDREARIADGLAAADKGEKALAEAEAKREEELAQARAQAQEILTAANRQASQIVEEAQTKARTDAERIRKSAEEESEREARRPARPCASASASSRCWVPRAWSSARSTPPSTPKCSTKSRASSKGLP